MLRIAVKTAIFQRRRPQYRHRLGRSKMFTKYPAFVMLWPLLEVLGIAFVLQFYAELIRPLSSSCSDSHDTLFHTLFSWLWVSNVTQYAGIFSRLVLYTLL